MQKAVVIFLLLFLASAIPITALSPDDDKNPPPTEDGWIAPATTEPDQPTRPKQSASDLLSLGDTSFDELYNNNKYMIDFIIFLLIFIGITLMVYPQSFGKGHAPLTIGLSLALSLGLIMWEKKNLNGESIFQAFFGTISLVFFIIIIIAFIILAIIRLSGGAGATTFFIIFLILALLSLWILLDPGEYFYDMTSDMNFMIDGNDGFKYLAIRVLIGSAIGAIITFFFMRRGPTTGGRTP